jgi:hypothetical protein
MTSSEPTSISSSTTILINIDDPKVDDIHKESEDIRNTETIICKKSTDDWIKLYLSKGYKSWLIILISAWLVILTYSLYNIYMLCSSQYPKIGGSRINISKLCFLSIAATMRGNL